MNKDAIILLRYDKNGFVLVSKKLLHKMKFQWPKTSGQIKEIDPQQFYMIQQKYWN